ncbi:MAG: O-antigen ligase family protein [Muribaculum sp.]|nr:O-antigen ligase family protein [Muribaculum sp.]
MHQSRTTKYKFVCAAFLIVIAIGIVESVYGWLQLMGFIKSLHIRYTVTGTFFNPGPYCAFMAVIFPLALSNVIGSNPNKPMKWISWIFLTLTITLMPILMGRSGWIAALVGIIWVLAFKEKLNRPTYLQIVVFALGTVTVFTAAYFLKPTSAIGRIFLWLIGLYSLNPSPFIGIGWRNVAGILGDRQEEYFASHPDSIFSQVAGCPEFAFNEYFQIGIAFGWGWTVIFITLLAYSLYCDIKSGNAGLGGSVIAFAVVCMASYPFQFPLFILLACAIIVASLASGTKYIFINYLLCAFVAGVGIYSIQSIRIYDKSTEKWANVRDVYLSKIKERDIRYLDSIWINCNTQPDYLFNYGSALRRMRLYEKSDSVLKMGLRVSSDPMFLTLMGRNMQDRGRYDEAARLYMRASNRLPSRLYPRYLLAKLYADTSYFKPTLFVDTYTRAKSMNPKVVSMAYLKMVEELDSMANKILKTSP